MMMAVSFERYGRLLLPGPGPVPAAVGDKVLVPTDAGPEVAECVWAPQWVDEDVGGLPVCAGLASRGRTWPGTRPTGASGPRPGWPPGGWSASTACR